INCRDMASSDQRPGDPRAANGLGGVVYSRLQDHIGIQHDAKSAEPAALFAQADDTVLPLLRQKCLQCWRADVEKISERVYVHAVANRRDFDSGNELDACGRARLRRLTTTSNGVVVGDAQHANAGAMGTIDELGRLAAAVRGSR